MNKRPHKTANSFRFMLACKQCGIELCWSTNPQIVCLCDKCKWQEMEKDAGLKIV